jgi:hypothetical protein
MIDTPMPDTAHPALANYAEMVRSSAASAVVLPIPMSLKALVEPADDTADTMRTRTLRRSRAWALAPFVGDPWTNEARYMWDVWTDDLGRHITGPARLVWRNPLRVEL